jgi:hypothetical protein
MPIVDSAKRSQRLLLPNTVSADRRGAAMSEKDNERVSLDHEHELQRINALVEADPQFLTIQRQVRMDDECDDCCESPCVCEPLSKWITDRVRSGYGDVTFTITEKGDIGILWWGPKGEKRWSFGNTAEEAIREAIRLLPVNVPPRT